MLLDSNIRVGRHFPIKPKYVEIIDDMPKELKNVYRFSNLLTERVYKGELTISDFTKIRGEVSSCSVLKSELLIKLNIFVLELSDEVAKEELKNLKERKFYQMDSSKENNKFSCANEIEKKLNQLPHLVIAELEKNMPGDDYDDGMLERKDYLMELADKSSDKESDEYKLMAEVYGDWVREVFVTKEFQDFLLSQTDRFCSKYIECIRVKISSIGKRIDSQKKSFTVESVYRVKDKQLKSQLKYSRYR